MNKILCSHFGVVVFGWLCQKVLCDEPNVRYHGPMISQSMPRLNYSYINLKKVPGHNLNVVPLFTITVRNLTNCYSECLKTKGSCKSMNVKDSLEWPGMLNCSLLDSDIFRNASLLVKETASTHFAIMVRITFSRG
jgi:PAN domain.